MTYGLFIIYQQPFWKVSAASRVMCHGTDRSGEGGRGREGSQKEKSEKAPGTLMMIQKDGFSLPSLFQQAPSIVPI